MAQDSIKQAEPQQKAKKVWEIKGFAIVPERIFKRAGIKGTTLQVYCALANYAAVNGGQWCYLTNEVLTRELSLTDRTVQRSLKQLTDWGEITVQLTHKGGGTYRQIWLKSPYQKHPDSLGGVTKSTPTDHDKHPDSLDAPDNKEIQVKERVSTASGATPANQELEGHVDWVLQMCAKHWGKEYRETVDGIGGNESRKNIRARIRDDGHTGTELYLVLLSKGEEWKDDQKMRQYLRPKTVFAKTHFAEYLENAKDQLRHMIANGDYSPDNCKVINRDGGKYFIPAQMPLPMASCAMRIEEIRQQLKFKDN